MASVHITVAGAGSGDVGVDAELVDRVTVTVRGVAGHSSRPHKAASPVGVAGALASRIEAGIAERIAGEAALVDGERAPSTFSFGKLQAGPEANGVLEGTVRAGTPEVRQIVLDALPEIVQEAFDVAVTQQIPSAVRDRFTVG